MTCTIKKNGIEIAQNVRYSLAFYWLEDLKREGIKNGAHVFFTGNDNTKVLSVVNGDISSVYQVEVN